MRSLLFAICITALVLGTVAAPSTAAQVSPPSPTPQPATLVGIVKDSTGAAIADAEVVMRDQGRGTRTDGQGRFTLTNDGAGTYRIWFRRLGFASVEYLWAARPGEHTEITVSLMPIPRTLDPMVVRAQEDKRAAAHASIFGTVVDSSGLPVSEAEVQLVGANSTGMTRANGGFLFKPLDVGTYVVRVRKLGFAPAMRTVQLIENDDREVVVRLHRLPIELDPVTVSAQSGYGEDNAPWEEFERRRQWVTSRSRILGPEDLKAYYSLPLDMAEKFMGTTGIPALSSAPRSIPQRGKDLPTQRSGDMGDAACILINGKDPVRQPLRMWGANDVAALEIYPSGTDVTGTVGARFRDGSCRPSVDPNNPAESRHPTYYVLWLKK